MAPAPPPQPQPVITVFTVPANDTEAIPGNTYTNIAITLTFLQANAFASLPAPGGNVGASGTQLGIEIWFDADQNSSTGELASCNGFNYGTGFDHAIDGTGLLFPRLADGTSRFSRYRAT